VYVDSTKSFICTTNAHTHTHTHIYIYALVGVLIKYFKTVLLCFVHRPKPSFHRNNYVSETVFPLSGEEEKVEHLLNWVCGSGISVELPAQAKRV